VGRKFHRRREESTTDKIEGLRLVSSLTVAMSPMVPKVGIRCKHMMKILDTCKGRGARSHSIGPM
jgi:hypothetical protein